MIQYGIVVHGGVGSPVSQSDGCERAAQKGRAILEQGGSALDAVTEAAVILEDDGRYNAGSGASLRLDGRTIEMDASLMTSAEKIGAVAGISRVKNPIRVAREVMTTPHVLLCAQGALSFARLRGFGDYYQPSEGARKRYAKVIQLVKEKNLEEVREAWEGFDLKENWNFDVGYDEIFACDTIGAVALDQNGILAAANSTGGASPMLMGRIGDSPMIGCGFFAGPAAAIATTGIGEQIIRKMLARQVYDWISHGEEVASACQRGTALFPKRVPIGIIAVSRRGSAIHSNQAMASFASVQT